MEQANGNKKKDSEEINQEWEASAFGEAPTVRQGVVGDRTSTQKDTAYLFLLA